MTEKGLAAWISTANTSSPTAISIAKDALVDILGCMIAGANDKSTRATAEVAQQFGSGSVITIGTSYKLPALWAAFVGGTAAHALDFDDNFAPSVTHATAVLGPALFALAYELNSSGAEVVDAYIGGLELHARLGRIVNPAHYEKGWHATSTIGTIGTAGACARLLKQPENQILAAISIASSMAAGSKKQFGSMMKPIHAGLAAKNALLAARMSEKGISGHPEFLTGKWGFPDLYGGETELHNNLRNSGLLSIETDGLLVKRFPCCAAAHRTLDGLATLRAQHNIAPEAIKLVEAIIPEFARSNLRYDDPQNEMEARFSLTYCGARVLQSGELRLDDLTASRVHDPLIRSLLKRFTIATRAGSVSEELGNNAEAALTRVHMQNGEVYEVRIGAPKGSISNRLSEDEIQKKFVDCCVWANIGHKANSLFSSAYALHNSAAFREFADHFSSNILQKS